MSIGKNPHRPEGKANTDNEHMQERWMSSGPPHEHPSQKEVAQQNRENMEQGGGPSVIPAEEQVGGSRPGVESRVKDAIVRRQDREAEEEGE